MTCHDPRSTLQSCVTARPGWRSRRGRILPPGPTYRRIGEQLGIHHEALHRWVKKVENGGASVPGVETVSGIERIRVLERENCELRRATEILKSPSTFFAAELDRPQL